MKQIKKLKATCGKKLRQVKDKLDNVKFYTANEAIEFLQKNSFTKFDETLEVVLKLGINLEQSNQTVRAAVQLPHGVGKKIRVAAFVKDDNIEIAKEAGADLAGLEDLIDDVKKGKINFDACIATPDVMPKISVIAKVLGPKGLMPNPKLDTVTKDVAEAIKRVKSGQVEFRADKTGIIHVGVGKLSFTTEALMGNIKTLMNAVLKAKPTNSKAAYLQKAFITSTMGPSLKLELASLTNR